MNIPQMTKIIETDIISIVSPVSGDESDNGTSSSKSVVVFLLVVEAFFVSLFLNSLFVNGVSSLMEYNGTFDGVALISIVGDGDIVVLGVIVTTGLLVGFTDGVGVNVCVDVGVIEVGDGDGEIVTTVVTVGVTIGVDVIICVLVCVTFGVDVTFGVAVTSGNFLEIICHSPELLTIVSQTSQPSPVTFKFTNALGAIIVACIPSDEIAKSFTYGIFQITDSAISSLVFVPSFTLRVYRGIVTLSFSVIFKTIDWSSRSVIFKPPF